MKKLSIVFAFTLILGLMEALGFADDGNDSIKEKGVVQITIEDSTGYRGSHYNQLEVSLDNTDVRIRGFQMDICDADDYLTCSGCKITKRTSDSTCESREIRSGCFRVVIFSFSNDLIEKGTGPIFNLTCDVSEEAPGGECRDLNIENVKVADEFNKPLPVISVPGQFCFDNCTTSDDCDAGLWCYYDQLCISGACQSTDRCPDDGAFCNGLEYCDEDNDECKNIEAPCTHCYSYGCTCDEDEHLCVGCNADYDCDGICNPGESDPDCTGSDNCPDVSNPYQGDGDGDGIGDHCDNCTDWDGDGYGDPGYDNNTCPSDNCPFCYNPIQKDKNGDGIGDICEGRVLPPVCLAEAIYGVSSEETELLRNYRDNILNKTPEGGKIIRLYYQYSPYVVEIIEENKEVKGELKAVIDKKLPFIRNKIGIKID